MPWPREQSTLQFGTQNQYDSAAGVRKALNDFLIASTLAAKQTVTDPYYAFTPGETVEQTYARDRILRKVAQAMTDPMMGTIWRTQYYGDPIRVATNPSKTELYNYLENVIKDQQAKGYGRTAQPLRYIVDGESKNIHFAPADKVTHNILEELTNSPWSEHQGMVSGTNTIDAMLNDPYFNRITQGKFSEFR